ncbi:hypothetical protein DPEC_G00375190 [Dallia pectoralis]|nr:hypothetical protein DPEC_G00375190 [Dallia pectoralis]
MERPSFVSTAKGELVLRATTAAQNAPKPPPGAKAKTPQEVEAEAQAYVVSQGGDPSMDLLVLSQHKIQFGKYWGHTFKWLLENDVGYTLQLVYSHQQERERSSSQSALMGNKDALTRYTQAFPEFVEALSFHKACDVARVRASLPGQEGQALVGFGQYKRERLQDLYIATDKERVGFVKWLKRKTPQSGSQMDAALKYFLWRDQEAGAAGAVVPTSTHVTPTPVPILPPPSRPARQKGPLGQVIAQYLGQRQPLTAQALQAKLIKVIKPSMKPTVSPQRPADPTDAELAQIVDDYENWPPADSVEMCPTGWRATLSTAQQQWIGQVLFTWKNNRAEVRTDLQLWYEPPQPRPIYNQPPASPDPFFACRLFLWMPVRLWAFKLTCPQADCRGNLRKSGVYTKTIRRVLDIDSWYLMATEYLACSRCTKKVVAWSQGIIRQLDEAHRCLFPAILTYKLSCDMRVVTLMRERSLGNSATQLHTKLWENHSEAWMRRSMQYLGECRHFLALGTGQRQFSLPPPMPPVPSPVWLLTVYSCDVLSRLDEVKARITSVFGSILKMDSTKKVTNKLAGAAAKTAAWATNVGNEYGQVLLSVLTCAEGEGLLPMAAGLIERYRLAGVPPPQLMYVDRDCCSSFGGSKTAAMFSAWDKLVVRLDIWHLMRRFAAGVSTESHQLYGVFMKQLSSCIFEWDAGDVRRLLEAKRSQLEVQQGIVGLTDGEVFSRLAKKEMARHCRRRTRGSSETELRIFELLETFVGAKGCDTMGIPLFDNARIKEIWREQRRHLHCIQDPPGVQLYTETGRLTKGGVSLPVYRCARGSTSLESFHLHINRFIPGTSANAMHFQAFLLDGLVRWNENRAAAAVEGQEQPLLSYSGHLQHSLNELSQLVLGVRLVKDHTVPREYTGELLGVEYLYSQTGKVLQDASVDPDVPDEVAAIQELDVEDEGFEDAGDNVEDPTIHVALPLPDALSSSSAVATTSGRDSQPGYQHVCNLAKALVQVRKCSGLSDSRVDRLIELWQALPEPDQRRVVYPPRHKDKLVKGRFKATKCPGVAGRESLQRVMVGTSSGPATWPDTSRLVEAICIRLCHLHPTTTFHGKVRRTRWALVMESYMRIRDAVLDSPRLMAQTNLQLFEISQRTLSQWYCMRQRDRERAILNQGLVSAPGPSFTAQPLPAARPRHFQLEGNQQPFLFLTPEDITRQAPQQRLHGPVPAAPAQPLTTLSQDSVTAAPYLPPPPCTTETVIQLPVSRSTAYRKRKLEEAGGPVKPRKVQTQYMCNRCGQPRRKDTGHSRIGGNSFCSVASGGKSVEEWVAEQKDAKGRGDGH